MKRLETELHFVSKKVPTIKLSVTLSNLNQVYGTEFATKHIQQYPSHLRHGATLPWEI